MASSLPNQHHSRIESNNIDPDDGNSWLCAACNLPIFATPFSGGGGAALLHDQCSNLPEMLKDCELHPQKPLLLGDNTSAATCSECSEKCGTKLYYCDDSDCGVVLDVACALPIKILHRSHRHRLVAVRGGADSSFLICGVCGVAHKETAAAVAYPENSISGYDLLKLYRMPLAGSAATGRSYFCTICGFWIHPECATAPNVIVHEKHVHPLVLYYDVIAALGVQPSMNLGFIIDPLLREWQDNYHRRRICAICEDDVVDMRLGIYSCIDCGNYYLHVKCAIADRRNFKPVLGREAVFQSLVRLPIPDEHHSIVNYVRESSSSNGDMDLLTVERIHEHFVGDGHRFIMQHHDHDHDRITNSDEEEDDLYDRVCDACLKIITRADDPFYSCSICPNLFLHDRCYSFPPLLTAVPAASWPSDPFSFVITENNRLSICSHCSCRLLRAFYDLDCLLPDTFTLDVSCALMPSIVTHEAHGTAHFLRLTESSRHSRGRACDCCSRSLDKLAYECRTCPNFALHTWCAMLPKTVTHKFDPHPLQLITRQRIRNNGVSDICEICEHEMDDKVWYYGCDRCDQSFHVDCIPCLDMLYKIKSLISVGEIRGDDVPTCRLIRGLTLQGHGHDYCSDVADEYDILASIR